MQSSTFIPDFNKDKKVERAQQVLPDFDTRKKISVTIEEPSSIG